MLRVLLVPFLMLTGGCRRANPEFQAPADANGDVAGTAARVNGTTCSSAVQCASGFCVDGICCADSCHPEDPSTCGHQGTCDGTGACRLFPSGTLCGVPSCVDGIEKAQSICDGHGACKPESTRMCSPYTCGSTSCAAACSGPAGCVPGTACSSGLCSPTLTDGLVGHWRFDDGQGLTAIDSSGNGNNGTLMNGPAWTTEGFTAAKFPNPGALTFDGKDDGVIVVDPVDGDLDFGTGPFSYSLWVYVTELTGNYDMPIWKGGSSAGVPGYDMELGTGGWSMAVADANSVSVSEFWNGPFLNQWVHLVGVRDPSAGELRTYTNGAFKGTSPNPPGSVSNPYDMHFGGDDAGHMLHGTLDDVRIYNRVLSPDEIAALYAGH